MTHKGQELVIFCFDCTEIICSNCCNFILKGTHSSHKCNLFKDSMDEILSEAYVYKKEIKDKIKPLSKKVIDLNSEILHLETQIHKMKKEKEEHQNNINIMQEFVQQEVNHENMLEFFSQAKFLINKPSTKTFLTKSVYGNYIYHYSEAINEGIQYLKVRLCKLSSCDHITLGVSLEKTNHNNYLGFNTKGYSFYAKKRKIHDTKFEEYGESFDTGDTITIIMNCNTKELSFEINGRNQGVAYKVSSLPVYFCISSYITSSDDVYQILDS